MSRSILVVSAFLTATTLWSQAELAPVGVTSGQTLRIRVSARAPDSCAAQLGFLDSDGKPVGPSSSVSLKAGESASLDLPSSAVVARPGQRAEIRPRLIPAPATVPSACQTVVSVLDTSAAPDRAVVPPNATGQAGGTQEKIKVSGQWTIEVRNPDGTLVTRREFENSLQPAGMVALVQLLAGAPSYFTAQIVPYFIFTWEVQLSGSVASNGPCTGGACVLAMSQDDNCIIPPASFFCGALTLSTPGGPISASNPYAGDLVLRGSFTAPQGGVVATVSTVPTVITIAPSGSGGTSNLTFTSFSGSPQLPVSVLAGQLVTVTVAIGFM